MNNQYVEPSVPPSRFRTESYEQQRLMDAWLKQLRPVLDAFLGSRYAHIYGHLVGNQWVKSDIGIQSWDPRKGGGGEWIETGFGWHPLHQDPQFGYGVLTRQLSYTKTGIDRANTHEEPKDDAPIFGKGAIIDLRGFSQDVQHRIDDVITESDEVSTTLDHEWHFDLSTQTTIGGSPLPGVSLEEQLTASTGAKWDNSKTTDRTKTHQHEVEDTVPCPAGDVTRIRVVRDTLGGGDDVDIWLQCDTSMRVIAPVTGHGRAHEWESCSGRGTYDGFTESRWNPYGFEIRTIQDLGPILHGGQVGFEPMEGWIARQPKAITDRITWLLDPESLKMHLAGDQTFTQFSDPSLKIDNPTFTSDAALRALADADGLPILRGGS